MGHYITAYYVQDLKPDDIHWTLADTGWAKTYEFIFLFYDPLCLTYQKRAYGNLYGQWIVGATILQHRQGICLCVIVKYTAFSTLSHNSNAKQIRCQENAYHFGSIPSVDILRPANGISHDDPRGFEVLRPSLCAALYVGW